MGADSDGGQAKGGASGKGGAKGDGNGAGKKTKSTSSQTARKVSCPLISTWASARAPDFLRFRLSVAVGFVVSAQSSAQSLFGSALHAPIWKGNRSDSCGESNLN